MINIYHRDISRFRTLSAEEEQELLKQVKLGDEQARKTLIESNLRLVTKIARQYRRPKIELLDLIQEGNIGLIEAVDKFDAEMGYRFSTYAVWSIRKAIQEFLGMEHDLVSIDAPILEEDGLMLNLSDTIVDEESILGSPTCAPIDTTIEEQEAIEQIYQHEHKLTLLQQKVITMLYGMDGQRPKSINEVAKVLGISRQRTQRIVDNAMRRLK
jgi:RNA polymerase nonessential primary-like sigma factor